MPELVAQGSEPQQRWRRPLAEGRPFIIGRTTAGWSVPWDPHISRQHGLVTWQQGQLSVERLPAARNAIFFHGQPQERFQLGVGEHFVIGGTTFSLVDDRIAIAHDAAGGRTEQVFRGNALRSVPFHDADQRLAVLSRLPELIRGAGSDDELIVRLIALLLTGIPRASAIAVVAHESDAAEPMRVLHWDRRVPSNAPFRPSARLIRQALDEAASVLWLWSDPARAAEEPYTLVGAVRWAFCTPVDVATSPRWVIYIAGEDPGERPRVPHELQGDVKFTELVAAMLASLRELRLLERQQASLAPFFAPLVLDALASRDPEDVLRPRETEVAVLFCDLRGFSRRAERDADHLLELLECVSQALGVMTRHILRFGGVVGDFHGDAAMGFWGWPLDQPDMVERAAQAALAIRAEFLETPPDPAGTAAVEFRVGIGLATGRAVAGRIGTRDQVKVTAFGPVVNLAARLESLTKSLNAPILMDRTTADRLRQRNDCQIRRVARVQIRGLQQPVEALELLPLSGERTVLSADSIARYEQALAAFEGGDWETAYTQLHDVPPHDRVKDLMTSLIIRYHRTPPTGWDGVVRLDG